MTDNGVYHSRSRHTRTRILLGVAGVALLLIGYALGRLQGSSAASPSPSSAAASSAASFSAAASSAAAPSAAASSAAASAPAEEPQGGTDAYNVIRAESATSYQGLDFQDTEDEGGGRNAGWISNGDWLRFDDINFSSTPATRFAARIASDVGGGTTGTIEVRLDTPTATPAGTMTVGNMGGWQKWQSQSVLITPITGKHTLYLTFTSSSGSEFVNLNYFAFSH